MTALTIDLEDTEARERWDATPIGGLYVHVVEGVVRRRCPRDCDCGCHVPLLNAIENHGTGPCPSRVHPPPEWVALSEQKCETFQPVCNRIGPNFGKPDHKVCPDCLGSGRPLVEVTSALPGCRRCQASWKQVELMGEAHRGGGYHVLCHKCGSEWDDPAESHGRREDGRLSIGKGTVEAVVPVVAGWLDGSTPYIAVRSDWRGWEAHYWDGTGWTAITKLLDSEPHVGTHWGVIVRKLA